MELVRLEDWGVAEEGCPGGITSISKLSLGLGLIGGGEVRGVGLWLCLDMDIYLLQKYDNCLVPFSLHKRSHKKSLYISTRQDTDRQRVHQQHTPAT